MLTNWVSAGQPPEQFWEQDIASFNAVMMGAARQAHDAYCRTVAGAWWGEFFAREKRVKRLQDYLPKPALTEREQNADRDEGARKLLMMMRRMKARQDEKAKGNG